MGFRLGIQQCLRDRNGDWPALIAYHLPPINYGEIVEAGDCEAFAAALLGMTTDCYYRLICRLADSIPGRRPENR